MWEVITGGQVYLVEGYYNTLANKALVYPSQGGRYHAEGCVELG
jgi:hypothetical protein